MRVTAAVAAGGVLGALARVGLTRAWVWDGHGWPWVTFGVNVAGALLLGFFATRLQERLPPSTYPRPLIGTGFFGALTTFSTLQVEAIQLARHGHAAVAFAYAGSTIVAGFAGVHLASAAARGVRSA